MRPVVDVLSDYLEGGGVQVADSRSHLQDVEHDLVDLQHRKDVRTSQFVGLALRLLQLESVEHALCHIVLADGLLFSSAVVVNDNELVPEEIELPSDDGGEVIIEAVDGAGTHDGDVGESLADDGLSLILGLVVDGSGVRSGTRSGEVDESMDSVLGAGVGNPFGNFNVDELKVLAFFEFMSGAEQVDDDIGVTDHALNLALVLVVHGVVNPRAV